MKIKKYIASILMGLLILGNAGLPGSVLAEEGTGEVVQTTEVSTPETPSVPEAPVVPETPITPEAPVAPSVPGLPTVPSTPITPEAPKAPSAPSVPEKPTAPTAPTAPTNTYKKPSSNTGSTQGSTQQNPYNGTSSSGNVGDTNLNTGDANNDSMIVTTGNNNGSSSDCCGGPSASVSNSGNGAGSSNQGSASTTTNNNTNQNNSAGVQNNLNQTSNTGGNDTNYNVGNSSISTGDANVTGTVITSVNTNVDGIMISEFNVVDDHNGDIILDFGANCIAGCGGQNLAVENSGNGAYSYNDASATSISNDNVDQTNIASIGNDLTLNANSGYNDASYNTGGDSNITTGDANVSANAITFANNNIAGDVIYGVVNIFGNLVGDIILTDEMLDYICGGTCGGDTNVANTGNGAGSTNLASATSETNNNVFQNNDADITNTLVLDATTGNNDSNFNTGGNSSIDTGSANIDANILNIANMNLSGGNMWLVIVNEAGNWVGKLYGATGGGNIAASALMSFLIDPVTGGVTATNADNGSGSVNNANTSSTTNSTINQNNTADINNTLNLSANTGGNTTNYNTGGDSSITTGDANITANIINFVNNNIVGNGKLLVTVVNVFGSWVGDFITPGHEKEANTVAQVAPTSNNSSSNGNSGSSNNGSSSNNSSSNNSNAAVAVVAAGIAGFGNYISGFQANAANNSVTDENENTLVAGITKVNSETAEKVRINMAWALVLLPIALGAGIILTRKIYLVRKTA